MAENQHIYAAIDLKSFYASVECVSRKLDTLTTNLVVADVTRSEKTICLAVSPSLKACGMGIASCTLRGIRNFSRSTFCAFDRVLIKRFPRCHGCFSS